MLRENLDTVLKDLLEFKNYENIDSKYPGAHLDLQNLQESFLENILPNRAHTDIEFKLDHPKFPYDIKDTLGDYEFDITTPSPVPIPTLDYTDIETQSNPEGLRYSLDFETTKYVDLDNSPPTKTTTVSIKKKKWEISKETVIHNIFNYMHQSTPTNKSNKSEILYRIRRYLDRELKRVPIQTRSVKYKIHHYFFNNEHDHVKRFYKSEKPDPKYKLLESIYNNKKKNHQELNNFPETKLKFPKVPISKRMRIGRKLQMYNNKNKIIPLNRKRQTRNAKESTELKPVIHGQSSVTSSVPESTIENFPFVEKLSLDPIPNIENYDLAKGDAALKARFLFKSCMNYEILEKRGHQPLLDLLNLLGGWPILNPKWEDDGFNWIELMAKLRLYNNDILISEWVGPDIKNSDEFVIQFDQTSLGKMIVYYFTLSCRHINPDFKKLLLYRFTYKRLFSSRCE